jgi:hypothetical protein
VRVRRGDEDVLLREAGVGEPLADVLHHPAGIMNRSTCTRATLRPSRSRTSARENSRVCWPWDVRSARVHPPR